MHHRANSLDDILRFAFEKLLLSKNSVTSSRGTSKELDGILFQLTNPRARLSRTEEKGTVFSGLGELLWYLSKKNDLAFIEYYLPKYRSDSEDGISIYGGYGPRFFDQRSENQIHNIINLLKSKPSTRRAVMQIFNAEDISNISLKERPCTCTIQFLLRNNKLNMYTTMRSNDAYYGLPHDIFSFTMLQEIIAKSLDVGLGQYFHMIGSLHLYDSKFLKAQSYLDEGWQDTVYMPQMPDGDPWESLTTLAKIESHIRLEQPYEINSHSIDPYWSDLIKLLQIYGANKEGNSKKIVQIKNTMHSNIYESYIRRKLPDQGLPKQMALDISAS
jgi:thymidylate synthase